MKLQKIDTNIDFIEKNTLQIEESGVFLTKCAICGKIVGTSSKSQASDTCSERCKLMSYYRILMNYEPKNLILMAELLKIKDYDASNLKNVSLLASKYYINLDYPKEKSMPNAKRAKIISLASGIKHDVTIKNPLIGGFGTACPTFEEARE